MIGGSIPRTRRPPSRSRAQPTAGRAFANYAWTRDAFIPRRDDFLGDYIGVAALNNKVYGVWAEIAPPAAPKEKDAPATERRPQTVVKVGVADFGAAASANH